MNELNSKGHAMKTTTSKENKPYTSRLALLCMKSPFAEGMSSNLLIYFPLVVAGGASNEVSKLSLEDWGSTGTIVFMQKIFHRLRFPRCFLPPPPPQSTVPERAPKGGWIGVEVFR
ncbi:hypothetical protein CEXT_582671 [Caerostris extrusa]|uniref:Uncharacterized protein n=1 Tax=Caerostris extrusa TaxID=172846 RepID=A0AAV4YFW2_CAEEX|nr:hypothetical protein CEXT_582671 [Caerostris extrusa]